MTQNEWDESTVEMITAGLILIVIALVIFTNIGNSTAMSLAGIILLGSGIYQTRKGWHVSLLTWILGATFFFGGLGIRMFLVTYLSINWIGVVLFLVGAYLIYERVFRQRN